MSLVEGEIAAKFVRPGIEFAATPVVRIHFVAEVVTA